MYRPKVNHIRYYNDTCTTKCRVTLIERQAKTTNQVITFSMIYRTIVRE